MLGPRLRIALAVIILVGGTVAAFAPALRAGWQWDDDDYVTRNDALQSIAGLKRIWTTLGATPQYYPLVFTTFWLEHHAWGDDPRGYHAVNVALHAANVVLLFALLSGLKLPGAFWCALLFAIHPVQVETVAWVTERKNLLSTFFYLLAALAYLRFDHRGRAGWYLLALVLFVAALLSKTTACTLPAAILLVVWWRDSRVGLRHWLAAVPMFAIGLAMGIVTAHVERSVVLELAAPTDIAGLGRLERLLIAGRALWFYAAKLVWPTNLAFCYERWHVDRHAAAWYLPTMAAIAVLTLLVAMRCRLGRGPAAAVLFFAVTLLPALGFVDIETMRYTFVADHYQYLACVGLFALAASGLGAVAATHRVGACLVGAAVCVALGVLSFRQASLYRDRQTLWTDTLDKNPQCCLAMRLLAREYDSVGEHDEADELRRRCLEIDPSYAEAAYDLGHSLAVRGETSEAIKALYQAVEANPKHFLAQSDLAALLTGTGSPATALVHFRAALATNPRSAVTYRNMVYALVALRRRDEALAAIDQALELEPENEDFRQIRDELESQPPTTRDR
ncbi:MAG TPA: tetratricopeptide repeat protein [Pirellulales bacterium]|jgi:tetratricopeptide (TPR) repeat protein|nr:tetratricopeptide repeat protein [Pirellulales bacterium]